MRNPAVSNVAMAELSDIPEWVYAEVFGTGMNVEPSAEDIKKLYEFSPIAINKNIKSNVMLMLGM